MAELAKMKVFIHVDIHSFFLNLRQVTFRKLERVPGLNLKEGRRHIVGLFMCRTDHLSSLLTIHKSSTKSNAIVSEIGRGVVGFRYNCVVLLTFKPFITIASCRFCRYSMFSGRSNAQQLSEEERRIKKHLERQLKLQCRLSKYKVQYQTAMERRDFNVAQRAAEQYQQLVAKQQQQQQQQLPSLPQLHEQLLLDAAQNDTGPARTIVESLYHRLQARLNNCYEEVTTSTTCTTNDEGSAAPSGGGGDASASATAAATNNNNNDNIKEIRYQKARSLLWHMHHATLEPTMLNDPDALRGYTRHKFIKRAMLVVHSLQKLKAYYYALSTNKESMLQEGHSCWMRVIWTRLMSVRTVVSIGCGPGCDGVGAVSFLWQHRSYDHDNGNNNNTRGRLPPPRVVFLDWAMDQWSFLLHPLVEEMLAYKDTKSKESSSSPSCLLISQVQMAACDVQAPLVEEEEKLEDMLGKQQKETTNARARQVLLQGKQSSQDEQDDIHLYLLSYVLSETRERWYAMLDDLVLRHSRPGTLFWIADPTAWQLHVFLQRYEAHLQAHTWLDSSMERPDLQGLNGRVGPAVLLAVKI